MKFSRVFASEAKQSSILGCRVAALLAMTGKHAQ
jgi:hypothetical protein